MFELEYKNSNILIVDDQEANIDVLLGLLLFQGYTNIQTTTDPRRVLNLFKKFNPDLILLDLMMPYLNGYDIMDQLKKIIPNDCYLPILVLTADMTNEVKQRALNCGANDFLSKPFDLIEVGLRIKNLLFTRYIHKQLLNQNITLETKVKERTSELEKSNIELIAAKNKAQESNKLKTSFLNNIHHEIRTPFNGIIGFLSLMQNEKFSEEDRTEFLEYVKESSNRIMNTINDIIIISKIHAGLVELTTAPSNINSIVLELYKKFNDKAKKNGLELKLTNKISKEFELINTDSSKIFIILTHLLENAIKFTKSGFIEFIIDTFSDKLLFLIRDTGIGIPEHSRELIFESFTQGDNSRTREFEGSGLGLAIVKAYVEMIGGQIWFESEVGSGSSFYFTLPRS